MKLFIPACGDRLTLTEPWTFELWLERRNMKFAESLGLLEEAEKGKYSIYSGDPYRSPLKKVLATLPAGTVIECDRVYIRSFNKARVHEGDDYDSVTWKLVDPKKGRAVRHGRFWTKLTGCNGLEFDLAYDALYQDRIKAVKAVMES